MTIDPITLQQIDNIYSLAYSGITAEDAANRLTPIESKISSHFGGATVEDVQVDEFSGMVYARINGNRSAYIGQAEDFA